MTKTVKNAIETMKKFNPYQENIHPADANVYNEIYDAMKTLASLNIISNEEWNTICKLDNKLFKETF